MSGLRNLSGETEIDVIMSIHHPLDGLTDTLKLLP